MQTKKPKTDYEALILKMQTKNIKFLECDIQKAKKYLTTSNYYMKVAAYRKNYEYKHTRNGKEYINLDFEYLIELSKIDMKLRYLILEMSLDIEHKIRTKLLNLVSNNSREDGYNLVREYRKRYSREYESTTNSLMYRKDSFGKQLYTKYNDNYPIWVFVEIISFGPLLKLCSLYKEMYNVEIYDNKILNNVREIRNVAAHSNCLIHNLNVVKNNDGLNINRIAKFVNSNSEISKNTKRKKMSNFSINYFISILVCYIDLLDKEIVSQRLTDLKELFFKRMPRNKNYFEDNNLLMSSYYFVSSYIELVDAQYNKC